MFQITKPADRIAYSLLLPSATMANPTTAESPAVFFAENIIVSSLSNPNGIQGIARGIACLEDPNNLGAVIRADGSNSINGFITRNGLVGGPTLADITMPNRTALPFQDGQPATFEYAEEYVAGNYLSAGQPDGYDHIVVAGAGAIASNTPIATPLSFSGGKTCKAQIGQFVEYSLSSTVETPLDAPSGAFCIRCRRVPGYLKTS